MKKLTVWLIGLSFLMVTFACDGPAIGNGCEEPDDTDVRRTTVPTCGEGVIDSEGTYDNDRQLFVNWTGPGAPTKPSNNPGFSEDGQPNPLNAYTWTLVPFGDHLYAGVYNRCNDTRGELGDISDGGELWRYEPGPTVNSGTWQKEMDAGFGNLSNLGVRIMAVYNDQLYVGLLNTDQGAELWRRSPDNAAGPGQWETLAVAGFGDATNTSVRSMAVFNGKLYLGTGNHRTGGKLYKFDADTDALSLVKKIGGAFTKVKVVSELVPIGDYMWIFSWGETAGINAFRMDRQENIVEVGMGDVGKTTYNGGIMSSAVFNGKLYVGTVNTATGAQLFVLENPATADLTDVVWNRVGANIFQVTETYLWRMQVFNGHLYIGTLNPYNYKAPLTSLNNMGATMYRMDQNEGFCQIMGHKRLIDGGFGQPENYGIRSMAEYKGRLYIGTAQVFKVDPGKDDSPAANREGTEVWEFDPKSN